MSVPPQKPVEGTVVLSVPSAGLEIQNFVEYEYASNFLTPTDGWHVVIGDDALVDNVVKTITPGTLVNFSINGHTQGTGFVDGVTVSSSRHGGTEVMVHGRDRLAQAVDSCVDPKLQLSAGSTLYDAIKAIFTPFGWSDDTQFLVTNDDNRNVKTGARRGTPTSKKGKPLKSFQCHQLKPYPGEGCFAFASRIAQRFGVWIWITNDANFLVISRPDFDQEPIYRLAHKRGPADIYNNIEQSTATVDYSDQPSVIVATGFGTGGEWPSSVFSLAVANPAIEAPFADIKGRYPNTRFIDWPDTAWSAPTAQLTYARPLFLHDDESKTSAELEFFLRREIALRVRKTLTYTAEVEGHGVAPASSDPGDPSALIWAIDTMVDVDDDASNVHEPLWVLARTFRKSRTGGTSTRLEMIRPHSLEI